MKEKVTTVYFCDYCKKKLFRKHAMEHHEKFCNKKPENETACQYCAHLKETTNTVESNIGDPYNGGGIEITVKAFECTKLNKMLYPLKVVRTGRLEKNPEWFEEQELMPNKCEHSTNNIIHAE